MASPKPADLLLENPEARALPHHRGLPPGQQRAPAPTSAPETESGSGWPEVVRYALENWPRTLRLCVIMIVVGAVLLLAVQLGFRFWL
jgi:hypothetical protein